MFKRIMLLIVFVVSLTATGLAVNNTAEAGWGWRRPYTSYYYGPPRSYYWYGPPRYRSYYYGGYYPRYRSYYYGYPRYYDYGYSPYYYYGRPRGVYFSVGF